MKVGDNMKEHVIELYRIRCKARKSIMQADNLYNLRLAHNNCSQEILDLYICGSISYEVAMHLCRQFDTWLELNKKKEK